MAGSPGGGVSRAAETSLLDAALATIASDQLKTHVEVLADDRFEGREAGARGGHAAAGYVISELEKLGLVGAAEDGGFLQPFRDGYRNILAKLPGEDPQLEKQAIVVGAHYDHVGYGNRQNSFGPLGKIHNGADDNASGVAGLLEIAQALASMPPSKRTIIVAFWDAEEKGLFGSIHWLAQPTWKLSDIGAAVNLDMIGRLRGRKLEVSGTRTALGLRKLVAGHNDRYDFALDFPWNMRNDSDHYSFFEKKIPVLMLHTGLHEQYHRPTDDIDTLDYDGARDVARFAACLAYDLANRPELPVFRERSRLESDSKRKSLETASQTASRKLGVKLSDATPTAAAPGLVVVEVDAGSVANQSGILRGDRLLLADGKTLTEIDDLRSAVLVAGKSMVLTVARVGRPAPFQLSIALPGAPVRVGLAWRWDQGEPGAAAVTRVEAGSPADRAGIQRRDRVYAVGGREFSSSDELATLFDRAEGPTELLIERQGKISPVTIHLPAAAAEAAAE